MTELSKVIRLDDVEYRLAQDGFSIKRIYPGRKGRLPDSPLWPEGYSGKMVYFLVCENLSDLFGISSWIIENTQYFDNFVLVPTYHE